ncbi:WD40 repeat domain-containing protein [Streptomyces sp. NPDC056943]|uniref:WD40 repeat domain-containing protein n=1 Tax=Streptomyces sp. NPDC056943 TaxID=3345971 RepID=UPI00362F2E3E
MAVSPDGRLGVCGGAREPVRLWELATGTLLREIGTCGAGAAGVVAAVWLGPDSRRAVSAGSDAEIRVWDVDSGECAVFPYPGSWVSLVCLSADGRLVLAAGHHQGRTLWLLDAGTGDFVRAFEDVRDSR